MTKKSMLFYASFIGTFVTKKKSMEIKRSLPTIKICVYFSSLFICIFIHFVINFPYSCLFIYLSVYLSVYLYVSNTSSKFTFPNFSYHFNKLVFFEFFVYTIYSTNFFFKKFACQDFEISLKNMFFLVFERVGRRSRP
jgi:hypothetical protein